MNRVLSFAGAMAGALGLFVIALGPAAAAGATHGAHATFAAGEPGDAKKPARTVEVLMDETDDGKALYGPSVINVKRGEQIRFVLKNVGDVDHAFIIDSAANNAKHKAAWAKNPNMSHDGPNGRRVKPGATAEILWHFTKAGTFEVACPVVGHTELGMKGVVIVK